MEADLILHNGRIYTMDKKVGYCSAVAISGNRIVALGSDDTIGTLLSSRGRKIDLEGRCVVPGLVDTHLHFQSYALSLQQLNLSDVPTLAEAVAMVKEAAPISDGVEWLEGRGWNQSDWPGEAFPTAKDMDRVAPDRPAYLRHRSGHAAWVNTKALQIANIGASTADPPGGEIQRDASGRPTGVLFEKAMKLVKECMPRPAVQEVQQAMIHAQRICLRAGLTGFHDFDGRICFRALQQLRSDDDLQLRVVKNIPVKQLHHATGVGLHSGFGDDWIRVGSVKLFADGALGPRTASMIDPYEGEQDNRGLIVTDKEEMYAHIVEAVHNGLSVAVHAIGDKANHDVLDVFEMVDLDSRKRNLPFALPSRQISHRIEHAQLLHPSDIDRFRRLGVIASMQPIHATSDIEMAQGHWGDRSQHAYAWRSLLDSGATLAFGSDAPIESIEPLTGIHAAVTRRRIDGVPGPEGWYPEQRLTVEEAVSGYTMGPAIASGRADYMGSISPGKLADLTILEGDIYGLPSQEIPGIVIAGTMVDGKFMYRNW